MELNRTLHFLFDFLASGARRDTARVSKPFDVHEPRATITRLANGIAAASSEKWTQLSPAALHNHLKTALLEADEPDEFFEGGSRVFGCGPAISLRERCLNLGFNQVAHLPEFIGSELLRIGYLPIVPLLRLH